MKKMPLKSLMNWMLVGAVFGLFIAGFRFLFDWNREVTNWVLFGSAGVVFLLFMVKLFLDYNKMNKRIDHYMSYLNNYDMDNYIRLVKEAIEKTKSKSLADIHLMNLSVGYAYIGDYKSAINLLAQVYKGKNNISETAVFCIINMMFYFIQLKDEKSALKCMETAGDVFKNYEGHPKYGMLLNINYGSLALLQNKLEEAEKHVHVADTLQKITNSEDLELQILKIKVYLKTKQSEKVAEVLEQLKDMSLPPVYSSWVKQLRV